MARQTFEKADGHEFIGTTVVVENKIEMTNTATPYLDTSGGTATWDLISGSTLALVIYDPIKTQNIVEIDTSNDIVKSNYDVEVTDSTKGIILKSPNGTRWRITVDNTGVLNTTSL